MPARRRRTPDPAPPLATAPACDAQASAARAARHRTAAGLALVDLEDAAGFLERMGLLLQTPHPYLPSLFGAAQGQPAKPGTGGFGQWPAHAWSWAGELAERDDVLLTKVLLGKRTLVQKRLWPALDAAVRERQPEDATERALLARDGQPTDEPRRWFAWPRAEVDGALVDRIETGALDVLPGGWLAPAVEPAGPPLD